jgi:hypothetical protein
VRRISLSVSIFLFFALGLTSSCSLNQGSGDEAEVTEVASDGGSEDLGDLSSNDLSGLLEEEEVVGSEKKIEENAKAEELNEDAGAVVQNNKEQVKRELAEAAEVASAPILAAAASGEFQYYTVKKRR